MFEKNGKVIDSRIEPVDRKLKPNEANIWRILIIFQLMGSLSRMSKHGIYHLNIKPSSIYLKHKYTPAWIDLAGFVVKKDFSQEVKHFDRSKIRGEHDKIEYNYKFGTYSKLKLFYKISNKPLRLSYRPGAQTRAFAILMVKIMDPKSSLYKAIYNIHSHKEAFDNYCDNQASPESLSCLFFKDLLTDMLTVPLDSLESIDVHYQKFIQRVNEIFNFENTFKLADVTYNNNIMLNIAKEINKSSQDSIFEFLKGWISSITINRRILNDASVNEFVQKSNYIESQLEKCVKHEEKDRTLAYNNINYSLKRYGSMSNGNEYFKGKCVEVADCYIKYMKENYRELQAWSSFKDIASIFSHLITKHPHNFKVMLERLVRESGLKEEMTADIWMTAIRDHLGISVDAQNLLI